MFISLSVCSSVERNEHDNREPPDSGACLLRELPRARFGEVLVASISELSAGLPAKTFCFHAE